jgi:hypothetical protein
MTNYSAGIEAFGDERIRQIEQEGYEPHADIGRAPELLRAAACYADWAAADMDGVGIDEPHPFWPWEDEDWKPGGSAMRAMEKSAALMAAAYDAIYAEFNHGLE